MKTLIIGDLHAPFIKEGYLEHCKAIQKKYKTDDVIFIGDIIDGHYSSFHVTDPDGLGGADELDAAVTQLKPWYEAFPEATVILGNHDRIVTRKAKMANLPSKWVRDYNEVLETPGWEWKITHESDGVLYMHGEGGTAKTLLKHYGQSVVQGHRHSECYLEYYFGPQQANFALQVGSGVDRETYALEYARAFKHQALACAVVVDGKQAYLETMQLNK